jgi:hypothetical protein
MIWSLMKKRRFLQVNQVEKKEVEKKGYHESRQPSEHGRVTGWQMV